MSPFGLKKRRVRLKEARTRHAPAYRVDGGAAEYHRDGGAPLEGRQEEPPEAPQITQPTPEKFQPLPRCPRCGTAIGYGQDRCHGCDAKLKGV